MFEIMLANNQAVNQLSHMSHILLTKTLTDGRNLTITCNGTMHVTATINSAVVCTAAIDRRATVTGAARMTKLPAEVVAVIGGKIALKAADLATIDAALAVSPYAVAAKIQTAKVLVGVKREVEFEREQNQIANRMGCGDVQA